MSNWKTCKHQFPEQHTTLKEPDFGVAYGSARVCKLCGAVEYENWCETRASGGTPFIFPPSTIEGVEETQQKRSSDIASWVASRSQKVQQLISEFPMGCYFTEPDGTVLYLIGYDEADGVAVSVCDPYEGLQLAKEYRRVMRASYLRTLPMTKREF